MRCSCPMFVTLNIVRRSRTRCVSDDMRIQTGARCYCSCDCCVGDAVSTCYTLQRLHCVSALTSLQTSVYFRSCVCDPLESDITECLDVQKRIFSHSCVQRSGTFHSLPFMLLLLLLLLTVSRVLACICGILPGQLNVCMGVPTGGTGTVPHFLDWRGRPC